MGSWPGSGGLARGGGNRVAELLEPVDMMALDALGVEPSEVIGAEVLIGLLSVEQMVRAAVSLTGGPAAR